MGAAFARSIADAQIYGVSQGAILGAAGNTVLEYYAFDRPLATLPRAAARGFMFGGAHGGPAGVLGYTVESIANATRAITR